MRVKREYRGCRSRSLGSVRNDICPTPLGEQWPIQSHSLVDSAKLLRSFLSGRSPRTIEAYSKDLADFQGFIGAITINDAAQLLLTRPHGAANATALEYRTHLAERGLQSATINRRMAALRSLVQLARTFGMVAWSLEVQNVRSEAYRDTKGPGLQGVKRLLNEAKRRKTPKSIRDHLALRLLFDLALRCGEVVSLTLEDVDLERGNLLVRGKGRTSKQPLTLPEPTMAALKDWLAVRGNEPGLLFRNFDRAKKGNALTAVSLYRIVRRLGEKTGVKARPHGLRHTAITEACKMAAAHNIGLEEVLDFSRHSRKSISVLLVYRDHERNLQGQLASMVAAQASPEAAA